MLERVVRDDRKSQYHLDTSLDLRRLTSALQIPTVLHGTTLKAWEAISQQPGLHRMSQNYIHLATGGRRRHNQGHGPNPQRCSSPSTLRAALKADVKFYVARDGLILTPGNADGYLERQFFQRVDLVKVSATPVRGMGPGRAARAAAHRVRRRRFQEVVHGTSVRAWDIISTQPGIHRMSRNHIHLGQGVKGNVVNGMQRPSEILINYRHRWRPHRGDSSSTSPAAVRSSRPATPTATSSADSSRASSPTVRRRPSRAQTLLRRWARIHKELYALPRRFPIPLIGLPVKNLSRPRAGFFQHLHRQESV
ncbi:hypothetical protein B0H16DRAFT_1593433 [Mycena metata]|uniref:2'-phosphotransferase n=1 Tax=Mycena metata TaxID=1033252 RepID=A0AAD7MP39_9AGAR|nr:hypothetical protein B0H16DRAFT_1593433 [Mycena metata]